MRKLVIGIVLLCSASCCISAETLDLARKTAVAAKKQEVALTEKLAGDDSKSAKAILKRAEDLSLATSGLADLIGAPKEGE